MNRDQKVALVTSVRKNLSESSFIVLLHYRGLSDAQLYGLRVSLKSKGMALKIIKNTLVKVAVEGTSLEGLKTYLSGPVAIAYCVSGDPVTLAKSVVEAAKENQILKVQVGYLDKSVLSVAGIENLSKLGSLKEVRSSFIGLIKDGQSKFLRVLNAPSGGVIAVINNYTASKTS